MRAYFNICLVILAIFTILVPSLECSESTTASVPTIMREIEDLKAALELEKVKRVALETNLHSLQNILYMIQSDVIRRFEVTNEQIDKFTRGQNVSFYARVSPAIEDIKPWETIVFSDVRTNIGNGYNSSTGEFTAPLTGPYVFYSNILSAADKVLETSLQVNGVNVMYVYSGGKYLGAGSNMAVVHLNTADVVKMVKHGPFGSEPFYIHNSWSTFSGFLLRADAATSLPINIPLA